MTLPINNDAELKRAKEWVRKFYTHLRELRSEPAPDEKAQKLLDLEAEGIMNQIKELKEEIKIYEANRPPSQFMEVKHRHLLSEADRMVQKYSHLLEESLNRKIEAIESKARAIPGDPYAPGADPMKASLLSEARVLKQVVLSVVQSRDQFTADAVEYHRKRLEERLALGARPAPKRSNRRARTHE